MNKAIEQTRQECRGAADRAYQALDALDKQMEQTEAILAHTRALLAIEVAKRTSKDTANGSAT